MIFTWQVSKIWFQSSDFLFKKKMPLFDIRSDRQIIALAIKAFKMKGEITLKKKKPQPGLRLKALVYTCFIVFLHRKYKGIDQLMRAVNREAS